jgi:hypothetical protein
MTKTLSVSITDIEQVEHLTISGTLHEGGFNETVVLGVGQTKIALNSQQLAEALSEIVKFQTPQSDMIAVLAEGMKNV